MQTQGNPFPGRRRSLVAARKDKIEEKPAPQPAFSFKDWKCPRCGKTLKKGIPRHIRNCKG